MRLGDHRYNKLLWIPNPASSAPGGYGPSHVDPLTGKVVASDAYIYGAGYERAAASIVDMIRLLSGDLEQTDYVNGSDLAIQIEAANQRYNEQRSELTLEQVTRSVRRLERSGLPQRIAEQVQTGELETNHFDDMVRPMVHAGLHKRLSMPELVTAAAGGLMDGSESQEEFERFNVGRSLARSQNEKNYDSSEPVLKRLISASSLTMRCFSWRADCAPNLSFRPTGSLITIRSDRSS